MHLEEVGYCGLYCGLCASRRRIPAQARALRDALRREGYDRGYYDLPGLAELFATFWKGLNLLADSPCAGCRAGAGDPGCTVRSCARGRGVEVCPLCTDFPCERLAGLRNYPLWKADAERLRQIGLARWIGEQEARAATGFAYADVRYPESPSETGADE